jgi:hypothetical protein
MPLRNCLHGPVLSSLSDSRALSARAAAKATASIASEPPWPEAPLVAGAAFEVVAVLAAASASARCCRLARRPPFRRRFGGGCRTAPDSLTGVFCVCGGGFYTARRKRTSKHHPRGKGKSFSVVRLWRRTSSACRPHRIESGFLGPPSRRGRGFGFFRLTKSASLSNFKLCWRCNSED